MPARTGHAASRQHWSTLTDLFVTAMVLVREGKRSTTQCESLTHALQLFKENRLGTITALEPVAPSRPLLELLSTPIDAEGIPRELRAYSDIVRFIGEFYTFDAWKRGGKAKHRKCRAALSQLGLPETMDLRDVGWIPPYATDPQIIEKWNMRMHDFMESRDCDDDGGCETVGEALRNEDAGGLADHLLRKHGLWLCMYVPPSWQTPARTPSCCADHGFLLWEGVRITTYVASRLEKIGVTDLAGLTRFSARVLRTLLGEDSANELIERARADDHEFKALTDDDLAYIDVTELKLGEYRGRVQNAGIHTLRQLTLLTDEEMERRIGYSAHKFVVGRLQGWGLTPLPVHAFDSLLADRLVSDTQMLPGAANVLADAGVKTLQEAGALTKERWIELFEDESSPLMRNAKEILAIERARVRPR